jgi:acetyl esterase/lipase
MRWFADRGWLVLSIDYSLSSPRRHLWNVTQGQVGCALSWVAENATAYGGDAQRLSLTGDSAGGNLAINTAYLRSAGQLPSACGGVAPDVDAVSVLYPAVHLAGIYDYSSAGRRFVTNYIGGSPKQLAERYAAVDSIEKINPNAPPTLILTGEADDLVSVDDIDAFAQRARDVGVNIKLVRFPHANHAFDLLPGSIGQQAYRQLTDQWLRAHGQQP